MEAKDRITNEHGLYIKEHRYFKYLGVVLKPRRYKWFHISESSYCWDKLRIEHIEHVDYIYDSVDADGKPNSRFYQPDDWWKYYLRDKDG